MGLRKSIRRYVQDRRRKSAAKTNFDFSAIAWLLDRPPTGDIISTITGSTEANDLDLVKRVMKSYQAAQSNFVPSKSFWDTSILKLNSDIHEALIGDNTDLAAAKLRNPKDNSHFWGFDSIAVAPKGATEPHQLLLENLDPYGDWREQFDLWTYDKLVTLAEAVGGRRLHYPESPRKHSHDSVDAILDQIEERLGVTLEFPNPYAGEVGLASRRGVASFRALQALYQAWRIREIADGRDNFKILEIGAGLGRTAFFANSLGLKNYSIIDLPMTGAAQGYFLGRTLGNEKVGFHNEAGRSEVQIIPSAALDELSHDFDLILNVDSFTEMSADAMNGYWDFILKATPRFLSINHDENERSVADLYRDRPDIKVTRYPYWMRRGYVEEDFNLKSN